MEKKKRILVVDDEEIIRDILSELLTNAGYEVSVSGDVLQSLEMAYNSDCIILDLKLSGKSDMEGGSILARLWKNEAFMAPVIIFSGFIYAETANEALLQIERLYGKGRKIANIIPKSGGLKNLIKAVNECIDRKQDK
jgi:CheY-like chemotaxis protein